MGEFEAFRRCVAGGNAVIAPHGPQAVGCSPPMLTANVWPFCESESFRPVENLVGPITEMRQPPFPPTHLLRVYKRHSVTQLSNSRGTLAGSPWCHVPAPFYLCGALLHLKSPSERMDQVCQVRCHSKSRGGARSTVGSTARGAQGTSKD